MPDRDAEIDHLFSLPLSEFTAERNALAKRLGKDGADIKAIQKPPVAAWAVNQLFFRDRATWDALIDASLELRKAHKAALEGRKADLRTAGREHDVAIDAALKSTLALMSEAGQPVTDATRSAILNTLRALPADESPGRLTRTLSPGGFEMLAGISIKGGPKAPAAKSAPARVTPAAPPASAKRADAKADREAARSREKRAAAERAVRDADQRARQAEFEAARAAREEKKAADRLEDARRALEEAQAALEDAERDATIASRARETADRRAKEAGAALEAAEARLQEIKE